MDAQTLANVMGNRLSLARYEELCPAFNAAMIQANCTTERRATMWVAQLGHESAGLQYMEEIADGSDYEWRVDLGNTQAGDGRRYKGRGPIQITGRFNYSKLSRWAFSNGYVPTDTFFVDAPGELAETRYAFLGPVWYWTVARDINAYADNDDMIGATRAINGGLHGLADRRTYWFRAGDAGSAILPTAPTTGDDAHMGIPELINDQLSGYQGKGWPILGPSKVEPARDNTLVEANAEIRDGVLALVAALLTPTPSMVEPEYLDGAEPAKLDAPTYSRTADYQAFHAARLAELAVTKVDALSVKLDLVLDVLGKLGVTK